MKSGLYVRRPSDGKLVPVTLDKERQCVESICMQVSKVVPVVVIGDVPFPKGFEYRSNGRLETIIGLLRFWGYDTEHVPERFREKAK